MMFSTELMNGLSTMLSSSCRYFLLLFRWGNYDSTVWQKVHIKSFIPLHDIITSYTWMDDSNSKLGTTHQLPLKPT
jgi:hypothetical protein